MVSNRQRSKELEKIWANRDNLNEEDIISLIVEKIDHHEVDNFIGAIIAYYYKKHPKRKNESSTCISFDGYFKKLKDSLENDQLQSNHILERIFDFYMRVDNDHTRAYIINNLLDIMKIND